VFQKFTLAKGTMVMEGQLIVPSGIKDIALFTIEGEKDDIAGIGQTRAAQDLCTGLPDRLKRHWEVPDVGHYGIFSGSTFRSKVAPEIAGWQRSVSFGQASGPTLMQDNMEQDKKGAIEVGKSRLDNVAEKDLRPAAPEPENASFWKRGPQRPGLSNNAIRKSKGTRIKTAVDNNVKGPK
jgi:hypothetical protein